MASFKTIANMLASDLQRDLGLTKEQAVGLVGNLAMESRGFQTLQEMQPVVAGSKGGYGYAQWTGPRRKAFEAYAKANNLAVDSYEANYGFLVKELKGTEAAALAALKKADTVQEAAAVAQSQFLRPGIPHTASRLDWTQQVADNYAYVPPGGIPEAPADRLAAIQDRNAAALGYGAIPPQALNRPNFFNETGAPPVPLNRPAPPPSLAERTGVQPLNPNMSPALQAARARLETARQARAGVQTPEALAVTPRLTQSNGEVDGIVDTRPGLDWDEFKPGMTAGGAGSLFDERISPSAANPAKPPVQGLRLPVSPSPSQSYAGQDRGQPHTASAPAPQRSGAANTNATAVPANRQPQYATTATGKQVELGKSYVIGKKLMIAERGEDGKAVFRDVEEYRDDWLRQNVDQNAPLVFDKGAAGSVARAIAAPMVKQGLAAAGDAAKDAIGNAASSALGTVAGAAKQAGNALSGFLSNASAMGKPANTLTVKPSVPQTYAGQEAAKPITKSIVNPAYTEWEKKYGDGSQVQTAATGAPITKNQLAAIQSMNGVTLPPAPAPAAPPPPPPKMITVTIPAPVAPVVVNTLPPAVAAAPAPVTKVANTLRMTAATAANYNALRRAGVDDWVDGPGGVYSPTIRDKHTSYHTGGSASNKANNGGSNKNDRMGTSSSGRSYDTNLQRWVS